MNFPRKIILLAAVALAISLGTACSFFDAAPAMNHQTAEPTTTSEATNSTLPPENGAANNAAATQPHPSKQTLPDDQRWCQAWALDNLKPHIYAEFVKLDPERMDDLDRTVWRKRLGKSANNSYLSGGIPTYHHESNVAKTTSWANRVGNCWMYSSEPLSKTNADRRNQQYAATCNRRLMQHADSRWEQLASHAVRHSDTAGYKTPNQYVRVLRWMEIPSQQLLKMNEPPFKLLRNLSDKPWAYSTSIDDGKPEDPDFDIQWKGIVRATIAGRDFEYGIKPCALYYPQLFYGYWVPFALPFEVPSNEWPDQLSKEEVTEIERLREGPLYLPRP